MAEKELDVSHLSPEDAATAKELDELFRNFTRFVL